MATSTHSEWLDLVPTSGPFLSPPVLDRVFPQGLDVLGKDVLAKLRLAYDEWNEDRTSENPDPRIHQEWIRFVLINILEFTPDVLHEESAIPSVLTAQFPEHQTSITPDFSISDPAATAAGKTLLIIKVYSSDTDLETSIPNETWAASPNERMKDHLRSSKVRLGVVTNGERFTLVDAPEGETPAFIDFYANLWIEEALTLRAFGSLLGARRFFAAAKTDTLEAMLQESVQYQAEVTDQLGLQVRRAVEVLIQSLDRADADHGGQLLGDIEPSRLYEAALTVMMRLVFMFKAEESGLLPADDELYEEVFAASTLRARLREEADRYGVEVLEHRMDAWPRLLAASRAIFGGVHHRRLNLPSYGSGLFDPDRFPFLEGRQPHTTWLDSEAEPLPMDNRTVLLLLEALQLLQFKGKGGATETRKLSFRALDIEQIGHVYETLLDHDAFRTDTAILGLKGSKGLEPEIALGRLETLWEVEDETEEIAAFLQKETGRSSSALENALAKEPSEVTMEKLRVACGDDDELLDRVRWYHDLIREDPWGNPIVIREGSVYVTAGTGRRSTGTYYTPKALTEEIVTHALEPLVYEGPANGREKADWKLRSPAELLELRICDPAMGSAAFLVQACRWLSDRLIESWEGLDTVGDFTPEGKPPSRKDGEILVPTESEERKFFARRLVAERCLFGVDKNPMAVEMAKLSMWLVTMARNRPFSFLDHNLRCGDSLLGLTDIAQLENFHIDPDRGKRIHDKHVIDLRDTWRPLIEKALEKRRQLEAFPVWGPKDAELKRRLLNEAEEALQPVVILADLIVGIALSTARESEQTQDDKFVAVAYELSQLVRNNLSSERLKGLRGRAEMWLDSDLQSDSGRRPLHWVLEFPEVITDRGDSGFDAVLGNPPFLGGQKITGTLGTAYREYLVETLASGARGSADLVGYFFLRAADVAKVSVGLLATNTIAQGGTRESGLDLMLSRGWSIRRATRSRKWPGGANLEISQIWLWRGLWNAESWLDDSEVARITSFLEPGTRVEGVARRLEANLEVAFQGVIILGDGFVVTDEKARGLVQQDRVNGEVVLPYLNGEDLNSRPDQSPSRWVINFGNRSLNEARRFRAPFQIVERLVKAEREGKRDQRAREKWWLPLRRRGELYEALAGLERALAIARVSKTVMPAFVPTGWVYSDATVVFAYEDDGHFGLLSSAFHWWWAVKHASTMRTDLRYTPTDCFETFPQPVITSALSEAGRALDERRRALMLDRKEGLTKTYNRVGDTTELSDDIVQLRQHHLELDHTVAAAYGWQDLTLDHDFFETSQGSKYTLSLSVRTEMLDRLLELNHQRYAEEVAKGLHGDKAKAELKKLRAQNSSLF